jgi:hypothetical protein
MLKPTLVFGRMLYEPDEEVVDPVVVTVDPELPV